MKNLKPIIFKAHSELKTAVPSIKKSQFYEAFAAFCGCKSYAAFRAATNISIDNHGLANRRCFERVQGLGFDASASLRVCQQIQQAWGQFTIIPLDDICTFYAETSFEEALNSKHMLNVLTSLMDENDVEALLVAIVISAQMLAEYKENPDNISGEHWFNKKLANQKISKPHSQVADQYKQIVPYKKLFALIFEKLENKNSTMLPSPSILKTIIEQFGDDYERCWSEYFSVEPNIVIEAIEYAMHHHDADEPLIPFHIYVDWIKAEMLAHPSREGLIEIIEATKNDEEKWFWYFIGLQHYIDITKDDYWLINSYTGEDWDEFGPAIPVGDDGVSLPAISDETKVKLKGIVANLY